MIGNEKRMAAVALLDKVRGLILIKSIGQLYIRGNFVSKTFFLCHFTLYCNDFAVCTQHEGERDQHVTQVGICMWRPQFSPSRVINHCCRFLSFSHQKEFFLIQPESGWPSWILSQINEYLFFILWSTAPGVILKLQETGGWIPKHLSDFFFSFYYAMLGYWSTSSDILIWRPLLYRYMGLLV